MHEQLVNIAAKELQLKVDIVKQVVELLESGNTVPFIARYRKEVTGGLDEVEIKSIQDTYEYTVQLFERKEEVIRLIAEQNKLTEELKEKIEASTKLQQIEDLYRPYRQKRRTRATIAREKGLEPLAKQVWDQTVENLSEVAEKYFSAEHEIETSTDVLAGVNDIVAEWISDNATHRTYIREATWKKGTLVTVVKEKEKDEHGVYSMYYDYSESVSSLVSHRVLAINRGEKEDILRVTLEAPTEQILTYLHEQVIGMPKDMECANLLEAAIEDSYKRLIQPSIEREIRNRLTEEAEEQAIAVFSENIRNLLLQPPLKGRTVLGIDPAYRTGCKTAVIDETGRMLAIDVMYPTPPRSDISGAERVMNRIVEEYPIDLIAIGNGTASRETEQFVAQFLEKHALNISYIIVDEAGASVYSASDLAREEFPNLEVEERSAVSIARRVQDPLAELVKIDPKSIGVGQYQHDVSQRELTESLNFVVETAVNQVGVDVNTASGSLLQHVAGLSRATAQNIVKKRAEIGKFTNRNQLQEVPRLGPKTYEQSVGFLRIVDGDHSLDKTPIHPESYQVTEELLNRLNLSIQDIGSEKLQTVLNEANLKQLAEELQIGLPTLEDIVSALQQPTRDVRDDYPQPLLQQKVLTLEDLKEGMELQGTVRNVVDFGAFVDIGVGQDGLVHISKLANKFVKHPMDIVSVGDVVTVWVEEVDIERKRIALSMIERT